MTQVIIVLGLAWRELPRTDLVPVSSHLRFLFLLI
jgi:hypothetical protein